MINRQNVGLTLGSAIVMASLYSFAVFMAAYVGRSDAWVHASVADSMREGGEWPPHFLYFIVINAISSSFGMPSKYTTILVVFIIVFLTFIVATRAIGEAVTGIGKHIVILSVCFLLLSHPIPIVFPYDQHIYLGYVASNVYHNPTILLLKLIALLHFSLLCKLLDFAETDQSNYLEVMLLAALSALSIIAKPNYIIILLPALLWLWFLCRFFIKKPRCGSFVIGAGVGAPAFLLLMGQLIYFYGSGSQGSIGIGIFEVFATSSELWTLVPKLIASFAFPVSVLVVMGSKLSRRLDFQLSALMLAVSLLYAYCLVDSVGGAGHAAGNFWWSAQIAHFLLLFVCIKAYFGFALNIENGLSGKIIVMPYFPLYIGIMQLISGVVWYTFNTWPELIRSGW